MGFLGRLVLVISNIRISISSEGDGTIIASSRGTLADCAIHVCRFYRNQNIFIRKRAGVFNFLAKKLETEKKIVDLSLLPPCQLNVKLHIMCTNYVASIFRNTDHLILDLKDPLWKTSKEDTRIMLQYISNTRKECLSWLKCSIYISIEQL